MPCMYYRMVQSLLTRLTWTDLSLLGSIDKVDDDVDGLDDAAHGVDCDEKALVRLEQRVVDP